MPCIGRHCGPPMPVLRASAAYFALVFGLGFAFGAIRTLVLALAPEVSRLDAVLAELPLMLAASWLISARLVRAFGVPPTFASRALMGGLAFVMLQAAELALAALLMQQTPAQYWRGLSETSNALGLVAQLAFATFPLLQLALRRR